MSDQLVALTVGDVVCLKSGGLKMTVVAVNDDQAECVWSTRADQKSRVFPMSSIRAFDDVTKIEVVFVSPQNDAATGGHHNA